jgi:hypothetical protein
MSHPLIIQTIAADQVRESHERAARARTARAIRRARPRAASGARSGRPLFPRLPHRALRSAA